MMSVTSTKGVSRKAFSIPRLCKPNGIKRPIPTRGLEWGPGCDPERSEGSGSPDEETLRGVYPERSAWAQGDGHALQMSRFALSLAARLIQAGRCFYLVEAIPEQVVRLFLRNVRVTYIGNHIGCGDELALLQVPEVDILLALLQASSRRQDRNALDLIVRQVRKNGVHALELIGRECTR